MPISYKSRLEEKKNSEAKRKESTQRILKVKENTKHFQGMNPYRTNKSVSKKSKVNELCKDSMCTISGGKRKSNKKRKTNKKK